MSPEHIRMMRGEEPKTRDRDLAAKLNITEAELVSAFCGEDVTRIDAHPDTIMRAAQQLGDVMALTRNEACVHEKIGKYDNYHTGKHAAMVLTQDIDLRFFPKHWCHAFMMDREGRKSLQVFDAAGDAVHKIHLKETSDLAAWDRLKSELAVEDQLPALSLEARKPVEAAKANPDKVDILRNEWAQLKDTHQFLRLTAKLKMNRLGAYRIAGEPYARRVLPDSVTQVLETVRARAVPLMIFVGNQGCIQIHSGPIHTLQPMGPWQNVMDPGFNLHLRADKIAEVWVVNKPTQRGPAISMEAFDARGSLITQFFGVGKEGQDTRPAWNEILAAIEPIETEVA